jgi:NitT/TauT family transport system substrate-binding protein
MKRLLRHAGNSGARLILPAMLVLLQAGAARAADLIPVQIGMPGDSLGYGSYYIAQDVGLFEKNGLKANFVFLTADAIPAALSTGGIQVSPLIGSAIRANLAGYKVKAVSLSLSKSTYAIVSKDSIKTMEGLKGKKVVAGPTKSTPTFLLRFVLEQHGMDPDKDVQIITVGSQSARRTLIQSGQADALIDSMKGVLELQRKLPGLHTLYPQSKMPDQSINGVATSVEQLEKNPDTIKRIIRAIAQADDFARKNPDQVAKVFAKYMKAPPEEGKELAEAFVISLSDRMVPSRQTLEQDARFLTMAADKPITVEQLNGAWDTRLAAEVEKEMGR